MRFIYKCIAIECVVLFIFLSAIAQPGSSIELKKPPEYENRTLGSEKTDEKKWGAFRHFYQNNITHYNYVFNASNDLNSIVATAKVSFQDNYAQLLPFYNYTLSATAAQRAMLDSVIYRCTAGILLHDLRNDWIDNLYLILGKAYYFRKDFDSAQAVFQFINYAFAPKDEGYDIPLGSNVSNKEGLFSISTQEKETVLKKITSEPPSRNEAILWLAKTLIEEQQPELSKSILEMLRTDAHFPERLQPALHETLAYWFYTQKIYDSAALHLIKALPNAGNNFEQARWEFLTAQLFQLSSDTASALKYYNKSMNHTPDVVMEVYAILQTVNLNSGNKELVAEEKINYLKSLAKKEKYALYKDIIYYAAAQLEWQRNHISAAQQLLQKSIAYSNNNAEQKNKAFLQLAQISYALQQYKEAKNYLDSVDVSLLPNYISKDSVEHIHKALQTIANNLFTVHVQDSLQRIALLSPQEREAVLKKILKQLRKQQGLKEEESETSINPAVLSSQNNNLFTNASSKGVWYFNDNNLRSSGFIQFQQFWGNRPNVDNWRRKADIDKLAAIQNNEENNDASSQQNQNISLPVITELSVSALEKNLPLTSEQLQQSDSLIAQALFQNGVVLQNELEDYNAAIIAYNTLNQRFAQHSFKEKTLLNLYACYLKTGNQLLADSCLSVLNKEFKNGTWKLAFQQKPPVPSSEKHPATVVYKEIYNLFLSGNFEKAEAEKKKADSLYGKHYWTPQLLFIEAIYYVSEKQDSTAIHRLTNLINLYPQSPLAERAATMIDVLKRRKEIETYLTNLQIKRYEEESLPVVTLTSTQPIVNKQEIKKDSVVARPVQPKTNIKLDTATAAPAIVKSFVFHPSEPQYVLILLDSVAPVFANETKNAFNRFNREKYYNQKIDIQSVKLNPRYHLVLLGPFSDAATALDYVQKTKPFTAGRILPWLTADKFSFYIISNENLNILKDNNDVEGYKQLLHKVLPNEF